MTNKDVLGKDQRSSAPQAGVTEALVDGDSRLWWLLHIMKAAGGRAASSDEPGEWIAAFCTDIEGRDPDTLYIAAERGYIAVSHNDMFDSSEATLTQKGRAALEAASAIPVQPLDRDTLGRMVREAWVRWAEQQPTPKPSWLLPYNELSEPDKEADRQIGETIAKWTVIHCDAQSSMSAIPVQVETKHALTAEQVADHIGVTPYSDMRPFVVQAVKYARETDAALSAQGEEKPVADGLSRAIAFVRQRCDDYVSEHGIYDPETNATEFSGNGDETVCEWEEIIEGLKALRAASLLPHGDNGER